MSAGQSTTTVFKTENTEGTVHAYTQEEKISIVEHINGLLKDDPDLKGRVPIDPFSEAIFEEVKDGIIIW